MPGGSRTNWSTSSWSGAFDRLGRDVHDPGQDLRHEASSDDCAGSRGGLRLGRELRDPRDDRILDGVGHVRLADGTAVRARLRAQRAQQLLDVERDAVGPLVDGSRHVTWGRQAGVEQERRDQRGLGLVERVEPELLGDALGDQARAPGAQVGAARDLLGPVIAGDEDSANRGIGGRARR